MVCDKCEKKLTKVIVPEKWKEGASNTTEGGGRKINENKLLLKKSRCGFQVYHSRVTTIYILVFSCLTIITTVLFLEKNTKHCASRVSSPVCALIRCQFLGVVCVQFLSSSMVCEGIHRMESQNA
ncbi:hypothetical protein M758_6G144100 [Ceratodon purpureus]|nr:hypothetical protein M758_6G144100 [Ceratodon purpureus]